mmetsp:Transcript_55153/g.167667  ORF Transcript_55153/g.167667 Transcript_55153/m.167667 type:complete len:618 (-) Transcript_55153:73-1926(-)
MLKPDGNGPGSTGEGPKGPDGDVARDPQVAFGDSALTFENVGFSVGKKVILEPMSGHFEPGSLVAVMGPSGSGKTTLLDILAGKKSVRHEGAVHVNGRTRDRLFRRLSAYVSQDDILPACLTVQEAVVFHQSLKQERPVGVSDETFAHASLRTLEELGLLGVKDEYIGDKSVRGISGGQRRRVSLACAFVHFPQIMFCDEPTSGLSATDAESCVKYMRLIAHRYGITMLVVIHQPRLEVTALFDELVLLTSRPGRCVYNGKMARLSEYCAAMGRPVPPYVRPTDHIMDHVTPDMGKCCEEEFVQRYGAEGRPAVDALVAAQMRHPRRSTLEAIALQRSMLEAFGSLPPLRRTRYGVRFRRQLALVGRRQLLLYVRDRQGILTDCVAAVLKGIILGLTYTSVGDQDASDQLCFFFMLMMATSIDGMKGMPKLIAERRLMKAETSEALYSEWAYIIPFTVVGWIQAVMSNTIFMVMLFALSTLQWPLFPPLWVWTTCLYITMDSMFLMLSAVAQDASTAFVMALPFFMLFLLFNGFTVNRVTAPWYVAWIVDISPVAYAMEQATIAAGHYYATPEYDAIADFFSYRDEPGNALGVMALVMLFFRVVQVVALKFFNNIKH